MSPSSEKRIKAFIDDFVRSEHVQAYQESAISSDFHVGGRFGRCYDAAEDGADGSTHQEVISDFRGAFREFIDSKRLWTPPERFIAAVENYFDDLETWHEKNGTLNQEIG